MRSTTMLLKAMRSDETRTNALARTVGAPPNPSLNWTRYGRPRLAAPGQLWYCPYAASRVLPTRAS